MVSDGIYAPALICSVGNFNGEAFCELEEREREGESEMYDGGADGKEKEQERGKDVEGRK